MAPRPPSFPCRSTWVVRVTAVLAFGLGLVHAGQAQSFPFTSGTIPLCDTTEFTANVTGVGTLITPNGWDWGPFLEQVLINITTDHPQTLQISLTSPEGTTLLLSEFNGAGGQNYTNTNFTYWGWNDITTASAPFTGSFYPQGGELDVFGGENANGTWTLTVVDTSCANGGTGPNGNWTPGWLNGSAGGGAMSFGYSAPPPPCDIWMGSAYATICPGGSVDVLSEFAATYPGIVLDVFDPNWNLVADPYAVTAAGYYMVQGSDGWGCWYWGEYQVIFNTGPDLGPDQSVSQCEGSGGLDLTALFALPAGTVQQWSFNGASIPTTSAGSANEAGLYTLVVGEPGGCSDTATVELTITPAPPLGPDQDLSMCAGQSIDLTALYDPGTWAEQWTLDGTPIAPPAAATTAGEYMLTVTDNAGCASVANVALAVLAMPDLGADASMDLCANATADLTALYNVQGFTASWMLNGSPVMDPASVGDPGLYQLVASGGPGCTDTVWVAVQGLATPDLGDDAWIVACEGDVVDLSAVFNTAGTTSIWTASGAPVADPASVSTTDLYVLVVTNTAGCSDTAEVDVFIAPAPVLGPDQEITTCANAPVDLTGLYATGADAALWTMDGVPVPDPGAATEAGTYLLEVVNLAGCTSAAQVIIAHLPTPALGADQAASICAGATFDLTALYSTAGLATAWTVAGSPVSDPAAVDVPGTYQLVVSNGSGCTDTAWVAFAVNTNPDLGEDLTFDLCPWQTVHLGEVFPVTGLNVAYTLDGQLVADPTSVYTAGSYVVVVTDANGCTDEAMAQVLNVECLCEADFEEDIRCMQEPARFTLLADSAVVAAHWEFAGAAPSSDAIDPLVNFHGSGEITVTLQALLSCGPVTVQRTISIQDCSDSCSVYIPSSFTPNGDGINDHWTWSGECPPQDYELVIYDRWGQAVFASSDPWEPWDGTMGGRELPVGVYVYRAGYRLLYQDRRDVMGSITLVR